MTQKEASELRRLIHEHIAAQLEVEKLRIVADSTFKNYSRYIDGLVEKEKE